MTDTSFGPVVSTAWLADHLGDPALRVLDATWYLPHSPARRARGVPRRRTSRAPSTSTSTRSPTVSRGCPTCCPDAATFAEAVGRSRRRRRRPGRRLRGEAPVGLGARLVDLPRVRARPGGRPRRRLPALARGGAARRDGGAEPGASPLHRAPSSGAGDRPRRRAPEPRRRGSRRSSTPDRPVASRATEPEPRPGLRGGHIPGSLSLPYDRLFRPDGTLLPPDDLRRAFEAARVDLDRPIVTTCGSGVTACVLALGLDLVGRPDVAVYDGSWTEWGGRDDVPVER